MLFRYYDSLIQILAGMKIEYLINDNEVKLAYPVLVWPLLNGGKNYADQ